MIDVSEYQGTINWQAVKDAGIDRVYIKLGEDPHPGAGLRRDPYAISNIHGARAVGITPGWYYFAHPGFNTGHQSALNFLSLAKCHVLKGDIPPALDLEVEEGLSWGQLDSWKAEWFIPVDAAIGTYAAFYSYEDFITHMTLYGTRPVWGAWKTDQLPQAQADRWFLWQHGTITVPGIQGPVDADKPLVSDADFPQVVTAYTC